MAIAVCTPVVTEHTEWLQHRVAGIVLAAFFFYEQLLAGRHAFWSSRMAYVVVGVLGWAIWKHGLDGFQIWHAVAGLIVCICYRSSPWASREEVREMVFLLFGSTLCFWAASRMLWWPTWGSPWMSATNVLIYLGAALLTARVLMSHQSEWADPARRWDRFSFAIDLLVWAGLTAAVLRATHLPSDAFAHLSVYSVPAEMVKAGHPLLAETPSQYGFLSVLLLTALPAGDCLTALHWTSNALTWVSGLIIYHVLKNWSRNWWWQLGSGAITIFAVAFISGHIRAMGGTLGYPSVGAMRFIWVEVLIAYLIWVRRLRPDQMVGGCGRITWLGSCLWLLGVLWSVESAVYVTATWWPASSLLNMPAETAGLAPLGRLRAFVAGIGRTLALSAGLLLAGVGGIGAYYRWTYSHWPDWQAYWEYAASFSDGFGAILIDAQGDVWVLVMLAMAIMASLLGMHIDRERPSVVLLWGAWGALWTTSTYFIARSHPNNILNLSPL